MFDAEQRFAAAAVLQWCWCWCWCCGPIDYTRRNFSIGADIKGKRQHCNMNYNSRGRDRRGGEAGSVPRVRSSHLGFLNPSHFMSCYGGFGDVQVLFCVRNEDPHPPLKQPNAVYTHTQKFLHASGWFELTIEWYGDPLFKTRLLWIHVCVS